MSSHPLSVAYTNTRYQVVSVKGSLTKPAVVPPTSLTFCHVPVAVLSCHWYWMFGDPLAVVFKFHVPPTQIAPPTGCADMLISGVTVTITVLE